MVEEEGPLKDEDWSVWLRTRGGGGARVAEEEGPPPLKDEDWSVWLRTRGGGGGRFAEGEWERMEETEEEACEACEALDCFRERNFSWRDAAEERGAGRDDMVEWGD